MRSISILVLLICIYGCGKKGSLEYPPIETGQSQYILNIIV